jgi:hypothetical protein
MFKIIDSEWLKNQLLDMQRWEDEGGHMIENNAPMSDRLSVPPVSTNAGRHHTLLQWNKRFVIEPFQPGNGIFLIRKNHATKTDFA